MVQVLPFRFGLLIASKWSFKFGGYAGENGFSISKHLASISLVMIVTTWVCGAILTWCQDMVSFLLMLSLPRSYHSLLLLSKFPKLVWSNDTHRKPVKEQGVVLVLNMHIHAHYRFMGKRCMEENRSSGSLDQSLLSLKSFCSPRTVNYLFRGFSRINPVRKLSLCLSLSSHPGYNSVMQWTGAY